MYCICKKRTKKKLSCKKAPKFIKKHFFKIISKIFQKKSNFSFTIDEIFDRIYTARQGGFLLVA